MSDQPQSIPTPEEGIDRKQLRVNLQRFRAINTARLERVRGMLHERHRLFLDLLPLLLHVNHPSLPGYVSPATPYGISGYTPDAATVRLARQVSRSFNWQRPPDTEDGVLAVYMMGSSGTIGHSDSSDVDVWVCYPEQLDKEALSLLQKKIEKLQDWAASLGLEAHLFLMNDTKFQRGQREPLTGENCGSAQHYLLMDEFYRTGILLAGSLPAWWLVPPSAETDYAGFVAQLMHKRYLGNTALIDFGGISGVPAGEFIGAGIWQLYKAIGSPYKSVLKLMLFEVYAAHFPQAVCLSTDYKRAIYAGIVDIDELDPYVMIYRRLEAHLLLRDEPERLEIVRRCLYYKAGKKLSRAPHRGVKSWQRKLMGRLVDEWGWDRAKLSMLDSHSQWSILDLTAERNELVRELNYSYRFLSEFARHSEAEASIDAREFSILGRRLYAAHDRKSGKIDMLNTAATVNVAESELSICIVPGTTAAAGTARWAAYPELVAPGGVPDSHPLKQSGCLIELIAWCVLNGVIGEFTRVAVREVEDGLRASEVDSIAREIREHILPAAQAGTLHDDAFVAPAHPLLMMMFVNVGTDPMQHSRSLGVHRVSSRTDSLGYSALRENLVQNIETLVCNSWGEVVASRYASEAGLVRCIREYLKLIAESTAPRPIVLIRSFCASRAPAIASRVRELFDDLDRSFLREPVGRNVRYVLGIENTLHVIQQSQGGGNAQVAGSLEELYAILGEPQTEWSALEVDRYAARSTPLPAMVQHLEPNTISVFCETQQDALLLTVVDEHGSWLQSRYAGAREASVLSAIDQFLASVRYRQNTTDTRRFLPRYFRLQRDSGHSEYVAKSLPLPANYRRGRYLNIQAIVEPRDSGNPAYTVWFDGESFSQQALGAEFHEHVIRRIMQLRHEREIYPAYITDVDLSAFAPNSQAPLQTIHYLHHKLALETEINAILQRSGMV